MEIVIVNKIEQKVDEYIERTGTTKTWICKQVGMSKQNLYNVFKSQKVGIDVLVKLSIVLDCKVDDLYDYIVMD